MNAMPTSEMANHYALVAATDDGGAWMLHAGHAESVRAAKEATSSVRIRDR